MYLTRATLRSQAQSETSQKSLREYLKKGWAAGKIRVFLSHSHVDVNDLSSQDLSGLLSLLVLFGGDIYIDWLDPEMPQETSRDTAAKIKSKIDTCDRFLLVATQNAVNSKWVPWELGYADKSKGTQNIAVIPIADPNGRWEGSEYLGLYPTVRITADNDLGVYGLGERQGAYMRNWLRG